MARHSIPYITASVPSSGAVPADSLAIVVNPDPPNEKFGFVGNYHVQARVDGVVSHAPVVLGLKGASGDLSLVEAHDIAHDARNRLLTDVPRLTDATVHISPQIIEPAASAPA